MNRAGELVRRLLVNLARRADLLDLSVIHHRDAVGQRQRLLLVVRHVEARRARLGMNAPQLAAQLQPQPRIEVRERLIEQDQPGINRQRPCQSNT